MNRCVFNKCEKVCYRHNTWKGVISFRCDKNNVNTHMILTRGLRINPTFLSITSPPSRVVYLLQWEWMKSGNLKPWKMTIELRKTKSRDCWACSKFKNEYFWNGLGWIRLVWTFKRQLFHENSNVRCSGLTLLNPAMGHTATKHRISLVACFLL